MKHSHFLFFLFISCCFIPLNAQLTPQTAIAEMGRGINLGNTLEPPTEGGWNNGPAQESYFDAYLAAGFSNVRIPVRWDMHTANTAPFAIDPSWMNRVEQVVDWGLARGFYITLNGHHEDWLKNGYNDPNLRARYDSIWVQIADRFQNKSEKLLFEIINEPKGMTAAQVDELNERILGIIRRTNPTRIVIYGGNEWANSAQLLSAAIPNDSFVVGYYHSYDPWRFSGLGQGTWGTAVDYQRMANQYQSVKNWSDENNIPVHHSEFGAIHPCDFNSRMRIYAYNVEQCLINGFAFSVWDDGGDFGILNRSNNSWPEVKDILVHYHEDSPNEIFSTFQPDPVTQDPRILVDWNNRASNTGDIILERAVGGTSDFMPIDTLSSNATSFIDTDVIGGKTYTYRMYTSRADGTLLHGYPTRIRIEATKQSPFNSSPIPIPGELEVEEFDNGGEGLAYHDDDAANLGGGFRLDEGVDIGGFGNGEYMLGYVNSGEWIEYTVNVAQAGRYSVQAVIASEVANGILRVTSNKNNTSTAFRFPQTGSWVSFQTVQANSDIELEAGEQELRLDIVNNSPFNIDKLIFTLESATDLEDKEIDEKSIKVAPNPTNGLVEVRFPYIAFDQKYQLEVYNSTGEMVENFVTKETDLILDLGHLPSGLYWLKLKDNATILAKSVVIF